MKSIYKLAGCLIKEEKVFCKIFSLLLLFTGTSKIGCERSCLPLKHIPY